MISEQQTTDLHSLRRVLRRLVDDETRQNGRRWNRDKRRHERHLCMAEAQATYVARYSKLAVGPDSFLIYTKDLSRSGLSFVHQFEMHRDEVVRVDLKTLQGLTRTLYLRVIRCRRAGLKAFDIAGEFMTEAEARATDLGKAPRKNQQEPTAVSGNGR